MLFLIPCFLLHPFLNLSSSGMPVLPVRCGFTAYLLHFSISIVFPVGFVTCLFSWEPSGFLLFLLMLSLCSLAVVCRLQLHFP